MTRETGSVDRARHAILEASTRTASAVAQRCMDAMMDVVDKDAALAEANACGTALRDAVGAFEATVRSEVSSQLAAEVARVEAERDAAQFAAVRLYTIGADVSTMLEEAPERFKLHPIARMLSERLDEFDDSDKAAWLVAHKKLSTSRAAEVAEARAKAGEEAARIVLGYAVITSVGGQTIAECRLDALAADIRALLAKPEPR